MPVNGQPLNWTGTAIGTGAANETACVQGVNCDTFTINVQGVDASWQGKYIKVKINWTNENNDYDLYIHKGPVTGPVVSTSGAGAPGTEEAGAIIPASTGTGTYTVNVVYFATTPQQDQYRGNATVTDLPPDGRSAIYMKGGMAFSANMPTNCPVSEADGEPSSRTDKLGNHYIAGIRGVPAGVDLWYFDLRPGSNMYDPYMRNPLYRGQPDSFTADESTSVGADGGGDVDLAVGFNSTGTPIVAFTSLVAANISAAKSTDRGVTWTLNPLGNVTGGVPVDDRQWIEFFGENVVYLLYRTLAPAVTQIQRSNDGGLTYGPARTAGAIGQTGCIDVDQNDGTVYISGSTGMIGIGEPLTPGGEPLTYRTVQVASDPAGVAHLFVVVKVADDGTVYVCYSNGSNIYLTHSIDKGLTWAPRVRVNDGPETRTSVFPWMETGSVPGSVGIAWYGSTDTTTSNDTADWQVYYATTYNAKSGMPTFWQNRVSDHVIHGANISEGGTLGDDNRNLLDYFQISFDPTGAAIIGYTDDHNDFSGFTYVTRQISGPSINGGHVPNPVEGSGLPPLPVPSRSDPQVTDFRKDVAYGLIGVVPNDDPLDILSIKYAVRSGPGAPLIMATMKVSDLSIIPPDSTWRMNFSANAPTPAIDGLLYSHGVSDRGDQFFLRAQSDAQGAMTYSWGTAVRTRSGGFTYTVKGPADVGTIDQATGTITVGVYGDKLSAVATRGAITYGTFLCGLRGQSFSTAHSAAKRDSTRGGRSFTIPGGGQ